MRLFGVIICLLILSRMNAQVSGRSLFNTHSVWFQNQTGFTSTVINHYQSGWHETWLSACYRPKQIGFQYFNNSLFGVSTVHSINQLNIIFPVRSFEIMTGGIFEMDIADGQLSYNRGFTAGVQLEKDQWLLQQEFSIVNQRLVGKNGFQFMFDEKVKISWLCDWSYYYRVEHQHSLGLQLGLSSDDFLMLELGVDTPKFALAFARIGNKISCLIKAQWHSQLGISPEVLIRL